MWPIQLPYGLSEHHRCFQTSGQLPVIKHGAFPRWQVLTLEQLAAVTLATPPASTFHSAPLRTLRDNNNNMGASESVFRDPTATPQTECKMRKLQEKREKHEKRKKLKPQEKCRILKPAEQRKKLKPQSQHSDETHHVAGRLRKKKKSRKEKTPQRRASEPGTQPGGHEKSPIILESDEEVTPHTAFADDGIELQLGDISDFELRKKTAQLLAIAPGLPVADLYHLLMEKEGHFEVAKQNVMRMSQTPLTSTSLPVREKTMPLADPVVEGEEIKVKIDFDDEFFIYDAECPETQLPDLRRPKPRSHTKEVKKGLQKSTLKPRKGVARKKSTEDSGEYTGDINRGIRETSHDREFIASDDEVPLDDSDADYSDSDQSVATVTSSSESDTDMAIDEESGCALSVSTEGAREMDTDDDEDLEIDMQPEYAYNADVWASPNPG